MYIKPKYGTEKMEVLLGDEPFARLVEEYMGQDARRYLDGLLEAKSSEDASDRYDDGYAEGYDDGYQDVLNDTVEE